MAFDKKAIKLYIQEQRRYHDELTISYENLRSKIATYTGATLAFLAFLYSGSRDSNKSTMERLFIPPTLYGKIFYFFGLFLVFYGLGKLIHGSRPNGVWTVALESKDVKKIEKISESDYLVELKDSFDSARESNVSQHNKKYEALRDSFYPLLIGAIILIVLRYFQ